MPGNNKSTELIGQTDAKGNPCWNETVVQELRIVQNQEVENIVCQVMKPKAKELLGEVVVNWAECLKFPMQDLSKHAFIFPLATQANPPEQNNT